jgi:diacylglycerol kinase
MIKILRSFQYAAKGLLYAFRSQRNLQIHGIISLAVIVAGWFFSIPASEWLAVFLCIGLVMGLELMNTAVEHLLDFIHSDQHPAVGRIKDIAAAAVAIAALAVAGVGLVIFPKYFVSLWHA